MLSTLVLTLARVTGSPNKYIVKSAELLCFQDVFVKVATFTPFHFREPQVLGRLSSHPPFLRLKQGKNIVRIGDPSKDPSNRRSAESDAKVEEKTRDTKRCAGWFVQVQETESTLRVRDVNLKPEHSP